MKSKVWFTDLRAGARENLLEKVARLVREAGMPDMIKPKDLAAVKLHFGEPGNTAFIRPVFIRRFVDVVRDAGGMPFLTDANTLYSGERSDAVSHLHSAVTNGFAFSVVDAPVVIADGLRGKTEVAVKVNLKHFDEVYVGREIVEADFMLSVAHFKGHELSGFGGAIKNTGMGCASRRGKMAQHSSISPKVKAKKCEGCGDCAPHCSQGAISFKKNQAGMVKASINGDKCIGCGECILICPVGAVVIQWNLSTSVFMENMVEYTAGVLKNKKDKAFFVNFITDVSPACDCYGYNDTPIVKDMGIMASKDPVALDQASADMVNREPGLAGTCLETDIAAGADKFRGMYPGVDWERQLEYAREIGLGVREYEMVTLS